MNLMQLITSQPEWIAVALAILLWWLSGREGGLRGLLAAIAKSSKGQKDQALEQDMGLVDRLLRRCKVCQRVDPERLQRIKRAVQDDIIPLLIDHHHGEQKEES